MAITANHTSITGPNARPIFAVPSGCTRNSATKIPVASGSTQCANPGKGPFNPSSAESTEIAGVIAPSP